MSRRLAAPGSGSGSGSGAGFRRGAGFSRAGAWRIPEREEPAACAAARAAAQGAGPQPTPQVSHRPRSIRTAPPAAARSSRSGAERPPRQGTISAPAWRSTSGTRAHSTARATGSSRGAISKPSTRNAPVGQAAAQRPQPMQPSVSSALDHSPPPSTALGQASRHSPHSAPGRRTIRQARASKATGSPCRRATKLSGLFFNQACITRVRLGSKFRPGLATAPCLATFGRYLHDPSQILKLQYLEDDAGGVAIIWDAPRHMIWPRSPPTSTRTSPCDGRCPCPASLDALRPLTRDGLRRCA